MPGFLYNRVPAWKPSLSYSQVLSNVLLRQRVPLLSSGLHVCQFLHTAALLAHSEQNRRIHTGILSDVPLRCVLTFSARSDGNIPAHGSLVSHYWHEYLLRIWDQLFAAYYAGMLPPFPLQDFPALPGKCHPGRYW